MPNVVIRLTDKRGDRHSFVGRLLCHNGVGPCGEVSSYSSRVHGLSMNYIESSPFTPRQYLGNI